MPQVARARFNQNSVYPICPLWQTGNGLLEHFLLSSFFLHSVHESTQNVIFAYEVKFDLSDCVSHREYLMKLIVDFLNAWLLNLRQKRAKNLIPCKTFDLEPAYPEMQVICGLEEVQSCMKNIFHSFKLWNIQ